MWAFSLFSKSHIGHVNHGKSENICGVGVSSTFLAVMRCSYQFFAVLRYSEPPNAPLRLVISHEESQRIYYQYMYLAPETKLTANPLYLQDNKG